MTKKRTHKSSSAARVNKSQKERHQLTRYEFYPILDKVSQPKTEKSDPESSETSASHRPGDCSGRRTR